jgi:hypothetical protein
MAASTRKFVSKPTTLYTGLFCVTVKTADAIKRMART